MILFTISVYKCKKFITTQISIIAYIIRQSKLIFYSCTSKPAVFHRIAAQPRLHRVLADISQHIQKICCRFYRFTPVPILKQMSQ